jgi:hypothetical protein
MTLAQMSITESTASPQHKLHWLAEQALNWSGLPVVHARLAGAPGAPPRDDGRSAPRGALGPDVGRRAHANRARAAERAGFRQEECGDIERVGKRGDLVSTQEERTWQI